MDQRLLAGGGILALLMILGAGATATGWINDSGEEETGFEVPDRFNDFDPDAPQEVSSDSFQYNINRNDIYTSSNITLNMQGLNLNQEYIFGFVSEDEFLPVKNFTSSSNGNYQLDYEMKPIERDVSFDSEKGYQYYLYNIDGSVAHQVPLHTGVTFFDLDTFDYPQNTGYSNRDQFNSELKNWNLTNINEPTSVSYSDSQFRVRTDDDRRSSAKITNTQTLEKGERQIIDFYGRVWSGMGSNNGIRMNVIQNGSQIGGYYLEADSSNSIEGNLLYYRENGRVYLENLDSGNTLIDSEITGEGDITLDIRGYISSVFDRNNNVELIVRDHVIVPEYMVDVVGEDITTVETEEPVSYTDFRQSISEENGIGVEFRSNNETEFSPFFNEVDTDYMELRNTERGEIDFLEFRIEEPENGMVQSIMSIFR